MKFSMVSRRTSLALSSILALLVVRVHGQPVELHARAVLKGHWGDANDVEFSPDGKILASVGTYDQTVRLWDPATGKALEVLKQPFQVGEIAFSPDGKTLAVGGYPPSKRATHPNRRRQPESIVGLVVLKTQKSIPVHEYNNNILFCLEFSPDGRTLAIGTNGGSEEVLLWNVAAKRTARVFAGGGLFISDVAFSPDGSVIATAGGFTTVRLWNAATGAELAVLRGHRALVQAVSFSPDGKYLASSSEDRTARIWSLRDNQPLHTLKGFNNAVDSVQYSRDGKLLATACRDGTVKILETKDYKELLWLRAHRLAVRKVTFSPDGKTLATGSHDHTVKLWDVDKLLAKIKARH